MYLLCFALLLTNCNDGDVLEVGLEFDQTLTLCNQNTINFLVYDTKRDPFESLSLLFPRNAASELIFTPLETPFASNFNINGSTIKFNYRTYNGNPENLLCQLVPDPNTNIINDYSASSGRVDTFTTFEDDDEDGIPTSAEDLNLDGDNNPDTNPTDTDGDGIPDYKDEDDDNDNILTKFENPNYTASEGLAAAQDSNGDGIPDYLDPDDDGDGVLTRYEDENADNNPRNDFDEASGTPDIPRYLDPTATQVYIVDTLVPNRFKRNYKVRFTLTDIDLQILSTDVIELGTLEYFIMFE